MKMFRFVPLFLLCLFIVACTPRQAKQGIYENSLVYTAQVPFSAGSTLPLASFQQSSALMYADGQYVSLPVMLTIYGEKSLDAPMSIVAFSAINNTNNWVWEYAGTSPPDNPIMSEPYFDGKKFYGTIHVLNGKEDPFTLWLAESEEEAAETYWLVQRYTQLSDFRMNKLVLEYREPLPKSLQELFLAEGFVINPQEPEMIAFSERAKASFLVNFAVPKTLELGQGPVENKRINRQYLDEFLGSLRPNDTYRAFP